MLVSFDIFDTALIRKCGEAENVFWLLAQRLFPHDRARQDDFFSWRRHAGENAGGPSLKDIYESGRGLFPPDSVSDWQQAELNMESQQLVANPRIRETIHKHRVAGDTICFISDMYLPSSFLTGILRREGCLEGDEKVYVSCEHGARKDTGELYETIRQECKPGKWLHYGDNLRSDVKMAQKHGIRAVHVNTRFTALERALCRGEAYCRYPQALRTLVGLSRYGRIVSGHRPEAILASDFLAAAYMPFVAWILEKAREQGLKRLFFLSRDGWILRNIALNLDPTIECLDLFVSRKALILPWLTLDFRPESLLLVEDHHTLVGRKIADILGHLKLTEDELAEFGVHFDYPRITTPKQQEDFLGKIFQSSFTDTLKTRAKGAYRRLVGYLKQSHLMDDAPSAMVDIGWIGTSRRMLNDILHQEGAREVPTFYYSVRRDVLPCRYGCYETFFPEGTLSTELTLVIENYLSASPYPSTLDYKLENGQWQPDWAGRGKGDLWNPVIRANGEITAHMGASWNVCPFPTDALKCWARNALEELLSLQTPIDLTPLTNIGDFDGMDFVRKLTLGECARKILFGARITAWDKASLTLTCGFPLKNLLWPLCEWTGKIRSHLYRRFLCRKNP